MPKKYGTFASVSFYENTAIKRYDSVDESYREILKELYALQLLDHPNVISMNKYVVGSMCEIVIPKMQCDLLDKINISADIGNKRHIMFQILCGVKHIHDAGIIHCDLKSNNILIDEEWNIKICDFNSMHIAGQVSNTWIFGNIQYRAPEIVKHIFLSKAADIYSLGIIFIQLINCSTTCSTKIPKSANDLERDLINRMLSKYYTRITADEALEHPYFDGLTPIVKEFIAPSLIHNPTDELIRIHELAGFSTEHLYLSAQILDQVDLDQHDVTVLVTTYYIAHCILTTGALIKLQKFADMLRINTADVNLRNIMSNIISKTFKKDKISHKTSLNL